ncbi:MAG: hypothetical protein QM718_06015 [Steroidobacteraceae bacterium]
MSRRLEAMCTAHRGAVLALLLVGGIGTAQAVPQFGGVWQPVDPPAALRTVEGREPPLLPAPKALYEQRKAQLAKGDKSFDPSSTRCAPPGEPRILTESMPFDIVQSDRMLMVGYQWNRLVRTIDIDKAEEVLSPYYFGTSTGHFSGDTLVVKATGFNDKFFLDRSGMPHSKQLQLTETFSLAAAGKTLKIHIRVEDPQTFSAPWETELTFRKLPNARVAEDICTLREKLVPAELQFFDPK